jgi:hypothetical protein
MTVISNCMLKINFWNVINIQELLKEGNVPNSLRCRANKIRKAGAPPLSLETKFEKVNMFRRIANPAELSYEYLKLD